LTVASETEYCKYKQRNEFQTMSVFMEECSSAMRGRHLAYRTEKSYLHWIKRFIVFHSKQHPNKLVEKDVIQFLNYIAVGRCCSPATQSQALCALVFLYRHVLHRPLGELNGITFAKKKIRVPVVLSQEEVMKIIGKIHGVDKLVVQLLYGSGLRVSEALALRIQDIDFNNTCMTIRMAKGNKDRVVTMALATIPQLKKQIKIALNQHQKDLENGWGSAPAPYALRRKLGTSLNAPGWQYVFPSSRLCAIPDTGEVVRFHRYPDNVRKSISRACKLGGVSKRVTCHTFRHSFATHLLQGGADIRTVQDQLGHVDVKTTEVYTHVLKRGASGVISPLDKL